uniref:Cadherin C-terminal catenin-binding domain-containing protein n=1 Tax=Chelydra serpentina TaxID=8475 RepID=A0A8C3T4K5_CHESE
MGMASGASNSIWTPRYGPLYPPHIPPLDYQHNVYIPGTPTMLANKEGLRPAAGQKRRWICST